MAKTFEQAMKLVNKVIKDNSIIFHNNFTAIQMGVIAERTPVKDGFATGNWDAGYTPTVVPTRSIDKTTNGTKAQSKALAQLKGGPSTVSGRTTYIKNGVVGKFKKGYIIQLENGKSQQAPFGMVRISIHNGNKIAKKAYKFKGGSL